MSSGGWGCPHEAQGRCNKVAQQPCDPGMKGCVLHGRFAFFNDDKNARLRQKQAQAAKNPASPRKSTKNADQS